MLIETKDWPVLVGAVKLAQKLCSSSMTANKRRIILVLSYLTPTSALQRVHRFPRV